MAKLFPKVHLSIVYKYVNFTKLAIANDLCVLSRSSATCPYGCVLLYLYGEKIAQKGPQLYLSRLYTLPRFGRNKVGATIFSLFIDLRAVTHFYMNFMI